MANKYGLPATIVEIENHVGHWKIGTGAASIVDEVRESRKMASKVHELLTVAKVPSTYFHDDTSTSKSENLKKLVAHHNQDTNGLVVSYHLNASGTVVQDGIGTEVIYASDYWKPLAEDLSVAIAKAGGFKNRGAKKRSDLYVLNGTKEPAILLETFFVNSKEDVERYNKHFDAICIAIATVLAGALGKTLAKNETKEELALQFTDNALKSQLDDRLKSPASHKLIDVAAVKNLGSTSKLKNGLMASGDFAATCAELAVYYAKKDK